MMLMIIVKLIFKHDPDSLDHVKSKKLQCIGNKMLLNIEVKNIYDGNYIVRLITIERLIKHQFKKRRGAEVIKLMLSV
ncbi:hypothetical protein F902_00650 [Acinetobacter higginsii]|uniref:Uncharacterized protein n=1 Tax=Acinetobacter higginsii TaxID=70347 RepID=N9RUH1_9GAMM|nr:hypothetical protein F902_00650 [Acinetobacter higginsii]